MLQRRSGPLDSRIALQAAVLSKRMGQEPVLMPAERGSGKAPEVTLFLRQLRQHWESQGSDVAANKCMSLLFMATCQHPVPTSAHTTDCFATTPTCFAFEVVAPRLAADKLDQRGYQSTAKTLRSVSLGVCELMLETGGEQSDLKS